MYYSVDGARDKKICLWREGEHPQWALTTTATSSQIGYGMNWICNGWKKGGIGMLKS